MAHIHQPKLIDIPLQGAAQKLKEAWYAGHRIIPIIGAGFSADCGVPILSDVVIYLALLHHYATNLKWRCESKVTPGISSYIHAYLSIKSGDQSVRNLIQYHGWPDRFDLYYEMAKTSDKPLVDVFHESMSKVASLINPRGRSALTDSDSILKNPSNEYWNREFDVLTNWQQLIKHITNHDPHLADSLFGSIYANRRPGSQHVLLTALIRILGIRTLFTFNFDDLVESALHLEDTHCRVFPMDFGACLPPSVLLDGDLTLIKMHGGLLHLLWDERLSDPLSSAYLSQFRQLIGVRPVLIILGCSGEDRRLRDMVKHALGECNGTVIWLNHGYRPLAKEVADLVEKSAKDNFILVHFRDITQTLLGMCSIITGRFPACRTPFKAHVSIPWTYPDEANASSKWQYTEKICRHLDEHKVAALCHYNRKHLADSKNQHSHLYVPSASAQLVECLPGIARQYKVIWVDLEYHYSLGDVVSSIVDQFRLADPGVSPIVFPVELSSARLNDDDRLGPFVIDTRTAANWVARALNRGKYLLVVDGIEAFPWGPTTHHGQSTSRDASRPAREVKALADFLEHLFLALQGSKGDSKMVLSLDQPRIRHNDSVKQREMQTALDVLAILTETAPFTNGIEKKPYQEHATSFVCHPKQIPIDGDLRDAPSLLWQSLEMDVDDVSRSAMCFLVHCVCTMRRSRNHHIMRELIGMWAPVLGIQMGIDEIMNVLESVRFKETALLRIVEGEGIILDRQMRDLIYEFNTRLLSRTRTNALSTSTPAGSVIRTIEQLQINIAVHESIAWVYDHSLFRPSNDFAYLLEHFYHRVSSLRYATLLEGVLHVCANPETISEFDRLVTSEYVNSSTQHGRPLVNEHRYLFVHCPCPGSQLRLRSWSDLVNSVKNYRASAFEMLCRTWNGDEVKIRVRVPAEKIINLSRELLEQDLEKGLLRGIRDRFNSKGSATLDAIDDSQVESQCNKFEKALTSTLSRCHYERGDFWEFLDPLLRHTPIGDDWTDIVNDLAQLRDNDERTTKILSEKIFDRLDGYLLEDDSLHQYLDIVIGLHWMLFLSNTHSYGSIGELIKRITAVINRLTGAIGVGRSKGQMLEGVARAYYIKIEIALGYLMLTHCVKRMPLVFGENVQQSRGLSPGVGVVEVGTQENNVKMDGTFDLSALERLIEEALGRIERAGVGSGETRNPILNPGHAWCVFLSYQSLFFILRARLRTMSAAAETSYEKLSIDEFVRVPRFRAAYNDSEQARAHADKRDPVLRALSDVFAAETALTQVRRLYEVDGTHEKLSGLIESKLRTVSKYLRSALATIIKAPRHITVCRLFYLIGSAYQYERLFALYGQMANEGQVEKNRLTSEVSDACGGNAIKFFARLDRLMQSIARAIDFSHVYTKLSIIECNVTWIGSLLLSIRMGQRLIAQLQSSGEGYAKGWPIGGNEKLVDDICQSFMKGAGYYGLNVSRRRMQRLKPIFRNFAVQDLAGAASGGFEPLKPMDERRIIADTIAKCDELPVGYLDEDYG